MVKLVEVVFLHLKVEQLSRRISTNVRKTFRCHTGMVQKQGMKVQVDLVAILTLAGEIFQVGMAKMEVQEVALFGLLLQSWLIFLILNCML